MSASSAGAGPGCGFPVVGWRRWPGCSSSWGGSPGNGAGDPEDDLVSALVSADIDGEALSGQQLGAFFSLLLVAGVETTRNAIAHGLFLLDRHPEQRELLRSDFDRYIGGAVDEIVRHSTPIIQFRRTVIAECALGGRTFLPGRKSLSFMRPPIATRRFSPIRIASTSPGRRIPIWGTEAGARTTAWEHIWPVSK